MSAVLVCVVDDHDSVREAMARFLRSAGHIVEVFGSGAELLDSGVLERTGCLVLDARMPEMSGPELFARLLAMPSRPPVILMTTPEDEELKTRLVEAGALDVLFKPFDGEVLLARVAEALRRAEALEAGPRSPPHPTKVG